MDIITRDDMIESLLGDWRERIGEDFAGYRGHVYRMFNFCLALRPCNEEERQKLAIAAVFHDIGLWSDRTVDYLPPSVREATRYLRGAGHDDWVEEIGLMIDLHHQLRAVRDDRFPLVEVFRQADLVDVSRGLVRFGLPRDFVRAVRNTIANDGFHRFLARTGAGWFRQHPLTLPPFIKW